jgi:hypothetical protein
VSTYQQAGFIVRRIYLLPNRHELFNREQASRMKGEQAAMCAVFKGPSLKVICLFRQHIDLSPHVGEGVEFMLIGHTVVLGSEFAKMACWYCPAIALRRIEN